MQMGINDSQTFGKMFESVEKVSSMVTFYTKLETRLLIRTSALTRQFASSLVKLYTATLQFLARAHRYFKENTFTMKSVPGRLHWANH